MDWIKKLTIMFWTIVGVVLVAVAVAFYWSHGVTIVNDQSDRTIGEGMMKMGTRQQRFLRGLLEIEHSMVLGFL